MRGAGISELTLRFDRSRSCVMVRTLDRRIVDVSGEEISEFFFENMENIPIGAFLFRMKAKTKKAGESRFALYHIRYRRTTLLSFRRSRVEARPFEKG